MTDISPAAQAVLDAYIRGIATTRRNAIAAALRTVVDQLGYSNVPEGFAHLRPLVIDCDDLLAIADELDAA